MARFASAPDSVHYNRLRALSLQSRPASCARRHWLIAAKAIKAKRILEGVFCRFQALMIETAVTYDIMKHEAIWRRRTESDSARPNSSGGRLRSGSGRMIVSLCGGGELAATPGFKLIWRTSLVPRSVLSRSAVNEPPN